MKKTGLFYGYKGGNTEEVAQIIAKEFNAGEIDVHDLSKISFLLLEEYDNFIFGIATVGADNWTDVTTKNTWDNFYMLLEKLDVKGKKAAIYGLGNHILYPDHFCDDMGILKARLTAQGIEVVGYTPASEYQFTGSKALEGDKFVGLPIDHDNEPELTQERVRKWVKKIKKEFI
ncbi:MAG TPA: flavodoxin [Bacteroidia bacterium]|nr:flavodoxin [Sphingobacteriales bacterium]HPD64508.1 flavodoxin [Bacteroidia bacterium]HRS58264.1 flavodoxin [Bacteroidia bacterium]HRU67696.1 flavodoxin [Bacteroidia bacterium]